MPRRRHRRLFLLAMLAWLVMAFGAQAMPCGCAAAAAAAGMDHGMAMAHGGDHARPDGHAHGHGACACAMACAAVAGVPLSSQPRHPRVTGANPPMAVQASVGDFTQTPLLRPPSA